MKKIALTIGFISLISFSYNTNNYRNKAYQALQVQEVLREELFYMYLKEGTIEAESRYVDAKYVEDLLKEIMQDGTKVENKIQTEYDN